MEFEFTKSMKTKYKICQIHNQKQIKNGINV